MEKQKIIISENLRQSLTTAIDEVKHDLLFVLCDETFRAHSVRGSCLGTS